MTAKVEPSKEALEVARGIISPNSYTSSSMVFFAERLQEAIASALDAFAAEAVAARDRLFCEALWNTLGTRGTAEVLAYVNRKRDAGQEGAAVGACCAEARRQVVEQYEAAGAECLDALMGDEDYREGYRDGVGYVLAARREPKP